MGDEFEFRDFIILVRLGVRIRDWNAFSADDIIHFELIFGMGCFTFLNARSRMTERCQSFICALALETSGEGCARICHQMGINISGDTVIRLLLRKFIEQETIFTGDIIGIDDFAFKKGHTYGTILVDGKTHQPIDLLNGRDGTTLRKWLKQNQQVKAVTRDRATAYARVLMEELPDVMQ